LSIMELGREAAMKSPVVKRSVVIGNHKTSVSLEEAFWDGMKEISRERGKTISELVREIDDRRQQAIYLWRYACSCLITLGQVPQAQLTYSCLCMPKRPIVIA
jgi:predicted DNA-binding ribbon-helix-helix protein